MIGLRDTAMLALTKLRTRKVRLIITIVISGLLFSGLAGASLVARGMFHGIADFSKEGLGSRFIVQAGLQPTNDFAANQTAINRALDIQKDLIARKKAAAKQLGISYDPDSEQSPVTEVNLPNGQKQTFLNSTTPSALQAIREYQAAHPTPGLTELKQAAAPYHPKAFYSSQMVTSGADGSTLQVLKNGQESYDQQLQGRPFKNNDPASAFIYNWQAMSKGLLLPFMLPGQNLKQGSDGSIPIVVPQGAAEQLLGLKKLPGSASGRDQLARTKEIRAKAPNVRFQVCYRNGTSASLLSQAITTKTAIEQNKDNKNYQQPDLVYGLPTQPCGEVPIVRDVRTKTEKTLAGKQTQFEQMFGAEPASQQTLTFRVVGIAPDPGYVGGSATRVSQIFRSIVASSPGGGWYMPDEFVAANPLIGTIFSGNSSPFASPKTYYAEFAASADDRKFLDKENCSIDYGKIYNKDSNKFKGEDPLTYCLAQGHPFQLNAYGSNSLALESAGKTFAKFFKLAALVISVIAAVIMMGTVGRMIADSRRETAVFRAIGAKRLDIAQVYITYALLLSLLVAAFALVIGFVLSSVANARWSADLTVDAINAFNAADLSKKFTLYIFYWPDMLTLIGLSLAAGLLSASLPLLRNLRRNPIRDMRDDT